MMNSRVCTKEEIQYDYFYFIKQRLFGKEQLEYTASHIQILE